MHNLTAFFLRTTSQCGQFFVSQLFVRRPHWSFALGLLLVISLLPHAAGAATTGLGTSDSTPVYTWRVRDSGGNVLREYKSEFHLSGVETLQWQRDYVHGGGRLLASDGNGSSIHLGLLAYHTDHLGTPRVISDSAGGVVSEHHYLPYGEEITEWLDQVPLKFTGHERDFPDLDYMRARYYRPSVARFLSVDPANDGWNLYAYGAGNPINRIDPTGLNDEAADDEEDQSAFTYVVPEENQKASGGRLERVRYPHKTQGVRYYIALDNNERVLGWTTNSQDIPKLLTGVKGARIQHFILAAHHSLTERKFWGTDHDRNANAVSDAQLIEAFRQAKFAEDATVELQMCNGQTCARQLFNYIGPRGGEDPTLIYWEGTNTQDPRTGFDLPNWLIRLSGDSDTQKGTRKVLPEPEE